MAFPRFMPGTRNQPDPLPGALEAGYRRVGAANRSILLAVSGGADSTALLLATPAIASSLGLRVEVASLDHGLRPESASEVEAVRAQAQALGLPFHTQRLELSGRIAMEERARASRYQALEELRRKAGLDLVATAHTASDQAETLLMRLCRGASLRGASAILPVRKNLVRPLLWTTRQEIERYLTSLQAGFIQDPMNQDRTLLRTRFRELLPQLNSIAGPGVERRLAQFCELARQDEELLSGLAGQALSRVRLPSGALDAVAVRSLLNPVRRRVLALYLEAAGLAVDSALIERALVALEKQGKATLTGGWVLKTAGGQVRLARSSSMPAQASAQSLALDGPPVRDEPSGLSLSLCSAPVSVSLALEVPDAPLPFEVRHRRPGDRVGRRKLQDLLVDLKVPEEERDEVPLVCDATGKILWVVGLWPSRRSARSTGRVLHLAAETLPRSRARGWLLRYTVADVSRQNSGGHLAVGWRYGKGF